MTKRSDTLTVSNDSQMHIYSKIDDLQQTLAGLKKEGKKIGFVPTMGALHEGHLSLIQRARSENEVVVASIFVNPTQFNNPEDLTNYPKTPEDDQMQLRSAGTDILLLPGDKEIYPDGPERKSLLELGDLNKVMEGANRPGHFDGVVQVVKRLFEIVEPDRAYFGEKDFQQLAVIRFMKKEMKLPVEIIGCETIREKSGLAMSSRNLRLTSGDQREASRISAALFFAHDHWKEYRPDGLKARIISSIEEGGKLKVEYVEIADADTLQPVSDWSKHEHVRCFAAVYCSGIRLIDNVPLF